MKVMRNIVGKDAAAEELIAYALDKEGVALACIGHFGMNTLDENAAIIANRGEGKKVKL